MLSDIMLNVTFKPSMLSIVMLVEILLNVIMLNVIMLNVIMLNAIMLSVVAAVDNLTKIDFYRQKFSTCPPSNVAKTLLAYLTQICVNRENASN
jgi:hypothetical protein